MKAQNESNVQAPIDFEAEIYKKEGDSQVNQPAIFKWRLNYQAQELTGKRIPTTDEFYHCYASPFSAVTLDPIPVDTKKSRLFLIEPEGLTEITVSEKSDS